MRLSAGVQLAVWVLALVAFTEHAGENVAPSDSPSPSAILQIVMETKTPFVGGLAGRAQCDDERNIYLRPTDDETFVKYHHASALPIREVKPDGSLVSSFSISGAAPGLLSIDFFVTGDGVVYQVARSESDRAVYVVTYSPNGSLRSKSRLETEFFVPYKVAVFRSGELLVSGIHGPYNRTPFTAVYSADGKLVREIYEPEDEDSRKRADAGEPGFRPDSIESSNDFVVRGDAALGSDGNVYLCRAASPALIYVISPKGEIVHKLRIASPEPGLWAGRLKSSSGMLAISFLRKDTNMGMIEVVDYDGRQVATYAPSDKRMYPGLLACYSPKRFTFLSLEDGSVRLNIAEPK